jgi:cell division septum initiation protein DivIVA
MTERARLEEQLQKVQKELDKASQAFESSVQNLQGLLGSKDPVRISAEKAAMQLWSEAIRVRAEEQGALQHRLEYITATELTRGATMAARSTSRAAWAMFWVALFAMVCSTTAAVMAAVIAGA